MLKHTQLFLITLITICFASHGYSSNEIVANPEFISSGLEWNGTASMRIGDHYNFHHFVFGGMIEVRNEERFDEGVFPNHNWRGFFLTEYSLFKLSSSFNVALGFEHESAHPTMGIETVPKTEYQYIYNEQYRRYSMNSFTLSLVKTFDFWGMINTWKIKNHFFFYSTNTPEIYDGDAYAQSFGFDFGTSFEYLFKRSSLFLSLYLNTQLDSKGMKTGDRWISDGDSFTIEYITEPVIQSSPTFNSRLGWNFPIVNKSLSVKLYTQYRWGHPRGFVDSREVRKDFGFGFMLSRDLM